MKMKPLPASLDVAEPVAFASQRSGFHEPAPAFSRADPPPRAPRSELPEPFRRLLALIDDEPSRLDARRILALLQDSGLAADFDDLFRHAAGVSLNVEVIAAIVVAELLGGPLGKYLSRETQRGVRSLRAYAQEASAALREMGRHTTALLQVSTAPIAHEVLRLVQSHEVRETLELFAGCRQMPDRVQIAVLKSTEKIKEYQVARAPAHGSILQH